MIFQLHKLNKVFLLKSIDSVSIIYVNFQEVFEFHTNIEKRVLALSAFMKLFQPSSVSLFFSAYRSTVCASVKSKKRIQSSGGIQGLCSNWLQNVLSSCFTFNLERFAEMFHLIFKVIL